MRKLGILLVGLCAIGLAGQARAQGEGGDNQRSTYQMHDSMVFVVTPDGVVTQTKVTDPAVPAMIMKGAKKLSAGTIIYMKGKDIYVASDRQMKNGKMLSEMAAGK